MGYLCPVGRLVYNNADNSFEIDDRTLAHLRIVFMNKLRRSEPFMFHVPPSDASGERDLWVHPAVPLVFHFYGGRQPAINKHWIDQLMHAASGPNGLQVMSEDVVEAEA
jgi:hypothetical protein